jgi:hypothetical protein
VEAIVIHQVALGSCMCPRRFTMAIGGPPHQRSRGMNERNLAAHMESWKMLESLDQSYGLWPSRLIDIQRHLVYHTGSFPRFSQLGPKG